MKELKYFRPYAIEVGIAFLAGVVVGRYIGGYRNASDVDKEELKDLIDDAVRPIKNNMKKRKLPTFKLEDGKLVIEVQR